MATTVRTARRPAAGRAVVVRPAGRVAVRPVRRRPVRRPVRVHPVLRRRVRVRRHEVPGWVLVAGALALLLLAGRGVAEVVPAPAPAARLVCTPPAGGPGDPVAGFRDAQLAHAAAIVAAGREMGVPERGQVIAVATAMQESKIRVYANEAVPASMGIPHEAVGSDHDSVGPFQQRQTWGPTSTLMDPAGSARLFYVRLLALPGWESMPLTRAAQAVQRSAHPDRYAPWEDAAAQVVAAVTSGITCTETRS